MTEQDPISTEKQDNLPNQQREVFNMALALGLGVGLIYLAFLKPGIWGIDGNEMFWVSHSLVTRGDFTVPPGAGVIGRGGQYYSIRYPLISILAAPLTGIGFILGNILGLPTRYTATLCALVLPVILTAITTAFVALLALRLGSSKKGAYLAALGYAFGTTALVYAREFFAEPVLAIITVMCLYWAIGKDYREHAGASILTGLAILAKPAGIVIGPLLCLYFLCKKYPWRTVIGPILGTGGGVLLYLGYNYLRFESFTSSGQSYDRFQLIGMISRFFGMLFSPGAGGGLFWYCPPTLLAFWGFRKVYKSKPLEALLVMGVFCSFLVLHSFWEFRGWNWGPRFLVPALPALLALSACIPKKSRHWLIALTVVGFFWNAPTLVSYYQRYYAEANDQGRFFQSLALWGNPLDAPLFNGWGAAFRQLGDAFSTNVKDIISQVGQPPQIDRVSTSELLKIVAVWWWMLPAAGIPIWVGFIIAMSMIFLGIWILRRGWLTIDNTKS